MEKLFMCKACLNTKLKKIDSTKEGEIVQCSLCGSKYILLFHEEILNKELEYGEAYRQSFSDKKIKMLVDLFNEYISKPNEVNLTLLDIGCGDGDFIDAVNKQGWAVTGLDCDTNAVNKLRHKQINAVYGYLGRDEILLNKKFHTITLWDVIEHIENIEMAMNWLSDHTEEQGKVVVITPDVNSIIDILAALEKNISFKRSKTLLNICLNRYHLNRFSNEGLTQLFGRHNFSITHLTAINLFSLLPQSYLNSFAPGIEKFSSHSRLNKIISYIGYNAIKTFNLTNKLFLIARKNA